MRSKKKNDFLPSLKNYRAFYKVYPEVGLEVAAYLRERFGKGYTACSLLVDAPALALPDKSYTACSQSSPNGLLVEYGDEIRISAEALFNRLSYRKHMMQPDDNPPVGILLCTAVGDETMEYVNTFIDPKLFVSKYQLQLPEKSQVTAFLKRENKVKSTVPTQRKNRVK